MNGRFARAVRVRKRNLSRGGVAAEASARGEQAGGVAGELPLESLGITLPLDEIYANLERVEIG